MVDARYQVSQTALMIAVWHGQLDIFSALVEQGANTNATNKFEESVLIMAVSSGHLNIVEILVGNGICINLIVCCIKNSMEV